MKKIPIIIYTLFLANLLFAQEPVLKWAKQFGGVQSEYGTSIVADAVGNVYTTGYFQDTVDFDPGPGIFNLVATGPVPSAFHINGFVSKLDTAGNFVWAKKIGGNHCLSNAITLDKSGALLITGFFQGTVDFDPGSAVFTLTAQREDIYICKLDVNGNFLWARQTAGNSISPNLGTSIAVDNAGNIFSAGIFSDTRDFDPGIGVFNLFSNSSAGYIIKLNSSGDFIWAKKIGEGVEEIQMVSDISGNIYSSGKFNQAADFDPGTNIFDLNPTGSNNTFISKLDMNGNFLWAKQIAAPRMGWKFEIDVDHSGNVYVPGNFQGTVDFDPGTGVYNLTAIGNMDLYILKLNPSGNFIWVKQIGGSGAVNTIGGIAVDLYENVYTSGSFSGAKDFDPGSSINLLTSLGQSDIFIFKLNSSGNFVWAKSMGAVNDYDGSTSLFVDSSRNIYTTGYFLGSTDFDPGLGVLNFNAVGDYDIFLQKLSECKNNTNAVITATACNTYTLNAETYTKTGTYYQSLQNVVGCDSLITLNLTINGGTKIFNENICNSYLWNNRIYTSSGTYIDTLIGSTGCDSILILNLTIHKNSFSTLNKSICQGQNFEGHTVAGIFTDTLSNINGCDSIRTLFLTIRASCIPVSIPNAFTPNKDGTNDIFKPIITQEVSDYSFTIFNRYGQKIFASNKYGTGWDGTFKGLAQPRNAYVYLLNFKNNNGELMEYKGTVTLIR